MLVPRGGPVSVAWEEHVRRLCEHPPRTGALSVVRRPKASVASGTFVSQHHLTIPRSPFQLLAPGGSDFLRALEGWLIITVIVLVREMGFLRLRTTAPCKRSRSFSVEKICCCTFVSCEYRDQNQRGGGRGSVF